MPAHSAIKFRRAWIIALLLPALAAAQDLIVRPQQGVVSPADAAPSSGVYVHDSALAMDRMALADRLQSLKEWGKAADVYQEIVEKYHDRVVPSHVDDSGTVDQYTSVLALVTDRLREWPPEGLAVYRARYELTASNLVGSADNDNLAPLHEAFTRYFVTDAGKAAGIKLIDAYFERGDFPAAAWIAQALLHHPNLDVDRPKVLFRAALAAHLSGDDKSAQAALDELANHFANALGTIHGQDVTLAGELKIDLARPAPVHALVGGGADDSWPTPGGEPSRGKISFSTAQPGARLYSIALPQTDWKGLRLDPNQRKMLQDQELPWRREGKDLGIIPVADRGELFFQDNLHVYAVNMETGEPLPGWMASYSGRGGQYSLPPDSNALALPIGDQLSLTLTETAVLGIMGLPDPLAVTYGQANQQDGEVVCLDRQSGKENWTFASHDLPGDGPKRLRFGGSPLVAGNNVFLSAFSNQGNGYEDCYVVCLDLTSGKYLWSCYIAGAPDAGQTIQNPSGQITTLADVPTHLAYASGRVYVSTNEGAVAALDAYSGNIAWLNIYREPDEAVNPNAMPMMMRGGWGGGFRGGFGGPMMPGAPWTPPAPWAANAPIVRGGDLFVLPSDGRYVMVYDAGDGHIVKRLRKSDCCMGVGDEGADVSAAVPDALLGVLDGADVLDGGSQKRQDLLLLATPDRVCAIKWRDYDPDHPSSAIEWASAHDPGKSLRGRPFVTADSAYIPMVQKLSRVAIRTGLIVQTYPADDTATAADTDTASDWPPGEGPGNVLVCGDYVVIAGDKGVSVYSDLSLARVRLDKEIAEAPADPNARLHYAEVMFRANQSATAAQKLDEAIQLLTAQDAPAARDRAFNDAVEFAVKTGASATATGYFDRAAALARWPDQQVSYRMKRAHFYRSGAKSDLGAAIGLYQEILGDKSMRIANAEATGSTSAASGIEMAQAGMMARREIDAIMGTPAGLAAYQPFERRAAAEFAAAQAAHDANRMGAVAVNYPNSSIAQKAEMAAAGEFETQGQSRQAAAVLRDVYPQLSDPAQRREVLTEMARNYLKVPDRLAAAAGRLAVAAQIDGNEKLLQPLVLPGQIIPAGTTLAAASALLAPLAEEPPARELELPSFEFPSRTVAREYHDRYHHAPDPFAPQEQKIEDVGKLLSPAADVARYDRVVTWTAERGLSIYALGEDRPIGTDADLVDEPRGAAWVNDAKDLLVWTGAQLLLVGGDTAHTHWKVSLGGLAELDVLSQQAPQASINLIQEMDPRMLGRARRNNLIPVRERPFMARPLPPPDAATAGAARSDSQETVATGEGETVVAAQPAGEVALFSTSSGRVAAVRLDDGTMQWQMRPSAHAVDRVLATEDFTVIKTTDESTVQLLVLDTASGRFLSRKLFDTQQGDQPVNVALSDDGTLVYSTADRLLIHDLFEAAGDPALTRPRAIADASPDRPFIDMTRPDQLLLRGGTILALTDNGVTLRGYSAQTGQLREFTQDSRLSAMLLPTGEHTQQTGLRLGDKYVYTWGPGSLAAYNLDHPEASWDPTDLTAAGAVRQILLGKDYLVLLSQPSDTAAGATAWTMSAFSRALVPGKQTESGLLCFQTQLADPQGIVAWQSIDGGLAYLAGDRTLHLLRGNLNPSPPPP